MHFESKMINKKQKFINLMVYVSSFKDKVSKHRPLVLSHGEILPPSHEELGLGSPLAANNNLIK